MLSYHDLKPKSSDFTHVIRVWQPHLLSLKPMIVSLFSGIIGNGLSAVVLSRPQMRSSVTCLLLGLTFCDTLLIFISIFTYSMQFMPPYINTEFLRKYSLIYWPLLAPYLYPISTTGKYHPRIFSLFYIKATHGMATMLSLLDMFMRNV
jgi:hypothetical protein